MHHPNKSRTSFCTDTANTIHFPSRGQKPSPNLLLEHFSIFLSGFDSSEPCLMCIDNNCISPKQSLYSVEYGKKWWWLCDQWNHCPDGTDERMGRPSVCKRNAKLSSLAGLDWKLCVCLCLFHTDICIPWEARSEGVLECQAARTIRPNNTRIALLSVFLCDGVKHCLHGEDEKQALCFQSSGLSSRAILTACS